jgi:soluble lytic murein transglycosylase-like protein
MSFTRKFWALGSVGIGPVGIAAAAVVVFAAVAAAITALMDDADPPRRLVVKPAVPVVRLAPPKRFPETLTHPIEPAIGPASEKRWSAEAFAEEEKMTLNQRMKRWDAFVEEAGKRFKVPKAWIRAVIIAESGGRTMLVPGQPITSSMGAMGLMQLMPETYEEMRTAHKLGIDPHDPRDNILAGTAYLGWLHRRYGYPAMFAAYNDGPGGLDQRIAEARLLPVETITYVERVTARVEGRRGALVKLTRPDGSPILVDGAAVRSVRAALREEFAPGVQTVITVGTVQQGVIEPVGRVRAVIASRGGATGAKTRTVTRLVLSCARLDPSETTGRITCSRGAAP